MRTQIDVVADRSGGTVGVYGVFGADGSPTRDRLSRRANEPMVAGVRRSRKAWITFAWIEHCFDQPARTVQAKFAIEHDGKFAIMFETPVASSVFVSFRPNFADHCRVYWNGYCLGKMRSIPADRTMARLSQIVAPTMRERRAMIPALTQE